MQSLPSPPTRHASPTAAQLIDHPPSWLMGYAPTAAPASSGHSAFTPEGDDHSLLYPEAGLLLALD
eukprot:scaffold132847_cov12-Tisochrysis_lutea.AAC.1